MVKRSLPSQPTDVERGEGRTMAENIYYRLRNDIIWGVLPPGSPLKSDQIRMAYDIGVSPLREALTRLTAERLVTATGQVGFRVAPLSADDVMDTAETRILIESEALRRSIERGNMSWETGLVAATHELRRTPLPTGPNAAAEVWAGVHRRFHAQLIAGCGSPWLIQLADTLFAQAERHRLRAVHLSGPIVDRNPQAEHDRIFDATLAKDAKLAVAELARHHRLSAKHVADTLSRAQHPPSSEAGVTAETYDESAQRASPRRVRAGAK